MNALPEIRTLSREALIHQLYEAAELEHNLMCTYLYAAFSLKSGTEEGLSAAEADATARWRRAILKVAVEEMGHLTAVWNITSALGGSPRFGRLNFPLDPGALPADVIVRLAPFSEAVLQHFIFLERPTCSDEPDGQGFDLPEFTFTRGIDRPRITPMPVDYRTVGEFYEKLAQNVKDFVARLGEKEAFCGDRNLQISRTEIDFQGCDPVICSKTALAAFEAIVSQGEGASEENPDSHYCRFLAIRREMRELTAANPAFTPAFPAAVNPVLRRPVRAGKRVWLENEEAAATVDVANTAYMLMLRLLSHSYLLPRPHPAKTLCIDLALGLMRAMAPLGERAARLPSGPTYPECNAGMSFTALRDAAPFPPGGSTAKFFVERFEELAGAARALLPLSNDDARVAQAVKVLTELTQRAERRFATAYASQAAPAPASAPATTATAAGAAAPGASNIEPGNVAPTPRTVDGVDYIEGRDLTLIYEGKKCIHSRFCVTWGPEVFIANVKGPWINPDNMPTEALAEIAHVCVSGAIRYRRKDGKPDEAAPPVNLVSVRENGPYAIRADIQLDGEPAVSHRLTLCRCGASKNKPFCDGSHNEVKFAASGEPPTGKADMLPVRDGPLAIDPQTDGPLQVRGNVEIISGTGRVVARLTSAKLCRCGGSNTKPFCDGSHARIGFRS